MNARKQQQRGAQMGNDIRVLVVYASRYGSTKDIAQFIAGRLEEHGLRVHVQSASEVHELERHDAVVVGSAVYLGAWMKEAAEFVRRNAANLSKRPVWLFSSGPLGTATTDGQGRDLRVVSRPKEFIEFEAAIKPQDHQVFFGALDPAKLRGGHRLIGMLPAAKKLLIEGDFRDWRDIEAWAGGIAEALVPAAPAAAMIR
jgi:menaquinone-dependent protoporphyrinogen oxidase